MCQGVLIPSGTVHSIDTRGSQVLIFLFECTCAVARQIRQLQFLSPETCAILTGLYSAFVQGGSYEQFTHSILQQLGLTGAASHVYDERILTAMDYIRTHAAENVTCKEVADAVFLSSGRFSHLFKEQVGMTFAAYRIYQRIVDVYCKVLQGKSITEAALEAGFSSSAHFADVNRRVFGTSISNITHDLTFCKVG